MQHVLQESTIDNVPRIAAVISGNEDQRHVGVLYRRGDDPLRKLHLGFHHFLLDEEVSVKSANGLSLWVGCDDLDDSEANVFATWLAKIFEKNRKTIPYGINYWKGPHFDPADGKYVQSKEGFGLTCATFVIALFEVFGYEIIDIETWPSRDDDNEFHERIIEMLRNPQQVRNVDIDSSEHQAHIQAQISGMGIAPRFRPEEVASSIGLYEGSALPYQVVEPAGRELVIKMQEAGLFS